MRARLDVVIPILAAKTRTLQGWAPNLISVANPADALALIRIVRESIIDRDDRDRADDGGGDGDGGDGRPPAPATRKVQRGRRGEGFRTKTFSYLKDDAPHGG